MFELFKRELSRDCRVCVIIWRRVWCIKNVKDRVKDVWDDARAIYSKINISYKNLGVRYLISNINLIINNQTTPKLTLLLQIQVLCRVFRLTILFYIQHLHNFFKLINLRYWIVFSTKKAISKTQPQVLITFSFAAKHVSATIQLSIVAAPRQSKTLSRTFEADWKYPSYHSQQLHQPTNTNSPPQSIFEFLTIPGSRLLDFTV